MVTKKSKIATYSVLFLVIVTIFIASYYFFRQPVKLMTSVTENEIIESNNNAEIELGSEFKYKVDVVSSSNVQHDVTFELKITNISVLPMITNFSFYECNYVDGNGTEFKGNLMTETALEKAILPNESQTVSITGLPNLNGYDRKNSGFEKCSFQEDGNKSCDIVSNLKIRDCTAYITTDGKQSSNGWGSDPIKVSFPL